MQRHPPLAVCAALSFAIWHASLARADSAHDQYQVAASHYRDGRWQMAVEEFRTFLDKHPGDARRDQATFYLAESLLQLTDFDEAAPLYASLKKCTDADLARKSLFRSGEAQFLAGRHAEAKPDLTDFAERYSQDRLNAFVLPYLATIALDEAQHADAERQFAKAIERYPNGDLIDDCHFGLARAMELRDPQESQRRYAKLVTEGSRRAAEAQYRLATVEYATRNYEDAAKSFAKAEQTATEPAAVSRAKFGRARCEYHLGKLDDAQPTFAALVDDETLAVEARYWLGLTHKARRQWDSAAAMLLASAKDETDARQRAEAYRLASEALLQAKRYAEAQSAIDQALAADPSDACRQDCLLSRLHVLLAEGKYDELETRAADFKKLSTDTAKLAVADRVLARSQIVRQQYGKAIEPLRSYLAGSHAANEAASAEAELAVCYAAERKLTEARETFAALSKRAGNAELIASTAKVLAKAALAAGDAKWAAELTSKFPETDATAQTTLLRAQVIEQQGDEQGAISAYEKIAELQPNTDEAYAALSRLARLHARRKAWADAAKVYERLAAAQPPRSDIDRVLYDWAWAASELRDTERAASLFERLRQEHPASALAADATYRLAEQAYGRQEYDRSEELLNTFKNRQLSPDLRQHVLCLQGQTAAARRDWSEVAAPLETLLKDYPESRLAVAARFWLAEAAYQQGDFDTAERRFDELARQTHDETRAWAAMIPLRRAQLLARRSQWAEVRELTTELESRHGDFELRHEVDYLIGRVHAARAEFDQARERYAKVIDSPRAGKTETAAMAQWMIGETYMHQKNYESALREYLKVEILYAYPQWQAASLLQAGKCYEQLARNSEADAAYRRLLREYPTTSYCQEAADRLKELQSNSVSVGSTQPARRAR